MRNFVLTGGLFLALAGCAATVDPADSTAPDVSVSLVQQGLPVIYHTDADVTTAEAGCAPGTTLKRPFTFVSKAYVTNGPDDIELLVGFVDPSGIENATIVFPLGPIEAPDGTTVTTISHGSTSTGTQARRYSFTGDPADPRTPHLVTIRHTPTGDNRTYNFTARDFAGNSRINTNFAVGNQAALCQ